MNLFKKKTKPKVRTQQPNRTPHKFSTKALEVEYNELMKNYESNPNEDTQRALQDISKILNDRAYEQGNGKLYHEIKEVFPQITQEKFRRMSESEKEHMKRILKAKRDVDEAARKLSEPEPERIEFSYEIDTPTKVKQDLSKNDSNISVDPTENQIIETPEEKTTLINEVRIENEKKPKLKGKKPGFFKKKIPIRPDLLKEAQASVNLDHDPKMQTHSDPPKKKGGWLAKLNQPAFGMKDKQREEQEEPIPKVKVPQEKLKGLFKKKETEPKQKLPDLLCPDCTHHIKNHQSKGKDAGCKCGCLNTVDDIAQKHGVSLNEKPRVQPKEIPKEAMDDVILQQAQTMASMKSQPKPKEIPKQIPPSEQPKQSLCANCDHVPKAHFDNSQFCTVIGCTCEAYRAYPD